MNFRNSTCERNSPKQCGKQQRARKADIAQNGDEPAGRPGRSQPCAQPIGIQKRLIGDAVPGRSLDIRLGLRFGENNGFDELLSEFSHRRIEQDDADTDGQRNKNAEQAGQRELTAQKGVSDEVECEYDADYAQHDNGAC